MVVVVVAVRVCVAWPRHVFLPTLATLMFVSLQVIPAIAPEVGHLTVFQRTPPYIMRKNDFTFPGG